MTPSYFDGCPTGPQGEVLRRHGDFFRRLPGDYYVAGGRVDDTMNLGGIKVSSAEIERSFESAGGHSRNGRRGRRATRSGSGRTGDVCGARPDAAERSPSDWKIEFNAVLKRELNPLFQVTAVTIVEQLPRTASNKVMRRLLRSP